MEPQPCTDTGWSICSLYAHSSISCCQKSSPVLCYCVRYFLENVLQTFNCTCWSLLPVEMLLSTNHSQVRQGQDKTMNGFKSSKELFETCCCCSSSFFWPCIILWGQQGEITAQFQQGALHKALTWTKCWEVICRKLSQSCLSSIIIIIAVEYMNATPSIIHKEKKPKYNGLSV